MIIALLAGSGTTYYVKSAETMTVTLTQQQTTVTSYTTRTTTSLLTTSEASFSSSTSSTCTSSAGTPCSQIFNQTIVASINYSGPWGLSYQTNLGTAGSSSDSIQSGSFYGDGSLNESIVIRANASELSSSGITTCMQAEKLDASSSLLVLSLPSSNSKNETFVAYGVVSLCVEFANSD